MRPSRWFAIESPGAGASGALAVIAAHGPPDAINAVFSTFAWDPIAIAAHAVRTVPIAGDLVVARPSADHIILTPLASQPIIDALCAALAAAGFAPAPAADPRELFPEAADLIEACILDAIARAPSPRAIDILLAQRTLWNDAAPQPIDPAMRALDHLAAPPRVVVVGRPNIGKSSALNAMATRAIAIAADAPGTTRDHIGADIDCDGLTVHWIDTPGIPAPGAAPVSDLDALAITRARESIAAADLILSAIDSLAGEVDPAELPPRARSLPTVRFALRADLGPIDPSISLRTSALHNEGFPELARAVRAALIPDAILAHPTRWRFHPALPEF